jgi:hypothetical protein
VDGNMKLFLKFGNNYFLIASAFYLLFLLGMDKSRMGVAVFGNGFAIIFLFYALLSFIAYLMLSINVYGRIALYYFIIGLLGITSIYLYSPIEPLRISQEDINTTFIPKEHSND